MTVIMFIMALAVIKVNQVNKTQLVNRTGQTFETGKVIRILEDNIQEDGMRVGQQSVVVKMTSGVKKGQELTILFLHITDFLYRMPKSFFRPLQDNNHL